MASRTRSALLVAGMLVAWPTAEAVRPSENHFGSIYIDGKRAGQVHYTVEFGENDEIETLRTRASLSVLGVKLFNFEQNLHEEWTKGRLRHLRGRTDDDNTIYNASLERVQDAYKGRLNDKPIDLPGNAYPASVWHYPIVEQSLLFDLKLLRPMNVKVGRTEETLTIHKRKIPTERFDFTGDWKATIWFDRNKRLVQFKYVVDSHEVTVNLDE
jgi:hypothetical protein